MWSKRTFCLFAMAYLPVSPTMARYPLPSRHQWEFPSVFAYQRHNNNYRRTHIWHKYSCMRHKLLINYLSNVNSPLALGRRRAHHTYHLRFFPRLSQKRSCAVAGRLISWLLSRHELRPPPVLIRYPRPAMVLMLCCLTSTNRRNSVKILTVW